ncbi:MAG: type II secretion system protein GspL, partial [Myxococcota bacterium]
IEGATPFDLSDVIVDWVQATQATDGSQILASVVQRSRVAQQLQTLRDAGIEPRVLEAEGLVLSNLSPIFPVGERRLLVDLGHRKTTLTLLLAGRPLLTRTIPLAGHALDEAIATDHGCSVEDAERLRREDGIFTSGFETTSPGALAILDRLAREIVRTLEAPAARAHGLEGNQGTGLTLIGGTSKLHGIDTYFTERTGIAAERLAFPPESEGGSLVAAGDPALFAHASALALRGTTRGTTAINFRQQEFAYRRNFRQLIGRDMRVPAGLAAAALVLLIARIGISIGMQGHQTEELQARTQALYSEVFPDEATPSNPITALREQTRLAEEQAEFLGAYGRKSSALDLLTEISSRIPEDLDVRFDELNINRRSVRVKVYAKSFESVDRLKAELSREPAFGAIKVAGDVQKDKRRGGVTFNLNIDLDG